MRTIILFFILFPCFSFAQEFSWNLQLDDPDNLYYFASIDNADQFNIMAVCNFHGVHRRILKSTDGGFTWEYVYKDTDGAPRPTYKAEMVTYPTKDFCIVSCDSATFLRTVNGGATWDTLSTEFGKYDSGGYYHAKMYDDKFGVIASIFHILISQDGFETWEEVPPFGDAGDFFIMSISSSGKNNIEILSRDLDGTPEFNWILYRTFNGGKTWNEFQLPKYKMPSKHLFVTPLIAYQIGSTLTGIGDTRQDKIYKTIDGGVNWKKVLDTLIQGGSNFGITDLDFYDKDNGIVVGTSGKIYWTHDGGETWIFDDGLTEVELYGPWNQKVCMLDQRTAVIATLEGKIFRGVSGATFVKTYDPSENNVRVIIGNSSAGFIIENEIAGELVLEIADLTGRAVYTGKHLVETEESRIDIDISGFVPGAYLYRVMQNNTKIGKGKFIVN